LWRDMRVVSGLGKAVRIAFVDCRHGPLLAIDKSKTTRVVVSYGRGP
jgi:hypothetical protein